MEFSILGPLEVRDDGRTVAIGGAKQGALLAVLLLHPNEPVSNERLALALWGEDAPASAVKTVQVYVSRLRRALGQPEMLTTTPAGYRLRVRPGELDAERFQQAIVEGRRALAEGAPYRAADLLREALELWRGPALADLSSLPFATSEIDRLEEERLGAVELRVQADLAAGRHAELVPELRQLAGRHAWRERLHSQLMLALYRCGRQAEALEAYRMARRALVDELGIEPSPQLSELEQAILRQDVALQAPAWRPRPRRLPTPLTRTVGREKDVRILAEWFGRDDVRLVTLMGPGGAGKTRLGVEVARALEPGLRDSAWFVSLAATSHPGHVASAVAQAVAIMPAGGETPMDAITRFFAEKRALVVLDNFEHLLPAAAVVTNLLAACPGLKLLATSREPLRVEAEHRFPVLPLALSADPGPAAVGDAPASALFVERASHHSPDFALTASNAGAVAEICRRLDGLPLAIELAAARTPLLGPEELRDRLARSLDALGPGARDAPARQRTLRATLDWSHGLLAPDERRAFARFAVFAGGACVDAAERVTGEGLDALEALVDKQLLERRVSATRTTRLTMLQTVREYARERLDAGSDVAEIRERHCRHYLDLVEAAEPALSTGAEAEWLPRLDADVDNIRAALDWSLEGAHPALGLHMAGLLAEFWDIRGMSGEGLGWLRKALEAAGDDSPIRDRARARRAQATLLEEQGSTYDTGGLIEEARTCAQDALALSRNAGDAAAIAGALLLVARLEPADGFPHRRRRALAQEALAHARRAGDRRLVAYALKDRALALGPDEGAQELEEAIAAARQIGASRNLAMIYNSAAYNSVCAGSPQRARGFVDQADAAALELHDPMMLAAISGTAGLAALFTDDLASARGAFEHQLRVCRELVIPWLASEGLAGLAAILARDDRPDRAARVLGAAGAHGPIGDADVLARLERDFFAPARKRYGDRRWHEAERAGAERGFAEAIDFALEAAATHRRAGDLR